MARQALSPVEGPKVEERAAFATTAPPPAVAAPLPAATPIRPAISTRDALQRIVGINPEIERLLNVQGVTRYAHIAAWGQPEIDRFDRLLGAPGRVRRENWIEQATMLARGGDTSGAKAATPNAPQPMAAPASTGASMLAAAAPAAMAAMASAPAPAAAPMPAPPMPAPPMPTPAAAAAVSPEMERMPPAAAGGVVPRTDLSALRSVRSDAYQPRGGEPRGALDDLKRIRGIGVLIEKRLNSVGVTSYQQIANWTNDDVARFSQMLDFKGRIERENWIEQARILAAGGYTEFSRRVDKGDVDTSRSRPN
jgi:predicted flap endonuclease-1-like 5' DNA nuclease